MRADGSIVPHGSIWTGSNVMNLRCGPAIPSFVPEKIIGGSEVWKNIIGAAQIMSAAALPIAIAGIF